MNSVPNPGPLDGVAPGALHAYVYPPTPPLGTTVHITEPPLDIDVGGKAEQVPLTALDTVTVVVGPQLLP